MTSRSLWLLLLLIVLVPASRAEVVRGAVSDSLSGDPVEGVAVVLTDAGGERGVATRFTDLDGRFHIDGVAPGNYLVRLVHVAYVDRERLVVVLPGGVAQVSVALLPSVEELEAFEVVGRRVAVTTSGHTAHYSLSADVLADAPLAEVTELLDLLPGVVVSGDRAFFRGVGYEHVLPVLDGVPVREPLRNQWIVPPPAGIASADFVAGAFGAEYGQQLGGVVNVGLARGGPERRAHLDYASDRFELIDREGRRQDRLTLSASGPTGVDGLTYALSWNGRYEDGRLAYDRGLPEHEVVGISLGDRMEGETFGTARATWSPPGAAWRSTATLLHRKERQREYTSTYARSGVVGVQSEFDRYTTFLADPSLADSTVFFAGPEHVPLSNQGSTMALATWERTDADDGRLRAHASLARHTYDVGPESLDLDDYATFLDWLADDTTDPGHQTETFHAVHGAMPLYEEGRNTTAALGVAAESWVHPDHLVKVGAGVSRGWTEYVGTNQGVSGGGAFALFSPAVVGSFDSTLVNTDAYAYLEDTWHADRLSSVQLSVRFDLQRLDVPGGHTTATSLAPRIAFHQPMTDVDAIHVQAGTFYQFPPLREHFVGRLGGEISGGIRVQRTRSVEVGLQHHFSEVLVGYLAGYLRDHTSILFTAPSPGEEEALFGEQTPFVPTTLEARGVELTLDHRFHPRVAGQVNLSLSSTERLDTSEVDTETEPLPWDRNLAAGAWVSIRPTDRTRVYLSSTWDPGRSYDICIAPRGACAGRHRRGRLPDRVSVDLGAGWSLGAPDRGLRLELEVRNLLDRRIPEFAFPVFPSTLSPTNVLAYYHDTGETDGYVLDTGDGEHPTEVAIPEARSAGRSVRIGISLDL